MGTSTYEKPHSGHGWMGVRFQTAPDRPTSDVIIHFRLHDPDRLLGDESDRGITLALIPRDTKGLDIGRRHFPLNVPFQNGPTQGKDVFVPLDFIIGGPAMAGQGWRMLVECLSVGRGITLPSNSTGGVKMLALATGAGAETRSQIGWVIVGGMSLGTLLTIFVVPTMYTLFARKAVPGAKSTVAVDAPTPHADGPGGSAPAHG